MTEEPDYDIIRDYTGAPSDVAKQASEPDGRRALRIVCSLCGGLWMGGGPVHSPRLVEREGRRVLVGCDNREVSRE